MRVWMKFNQTMKTKVIQKRVLDFLIPNRFPGSTPKVKIAVLIALITLPIINYMFIWNGTLAFPEKYEFKRISAHNQTGLEAHKNEAISLPSLEEKTVSMSAYTSRVEETDSTPCISADGTNICKYDGCVVASNDYPFDTVVDIEGFGECVVKDRMSSRYTGTGNMDMYFGHDLEGAIQFGRQNLKIRTTS